jgi:hypothetical protein
MSQLLALLLPSAFLRQPLIVLTLQTRQAVHAINQSIFLGCLWSVIALFMFDVYGLEREPILLMGFRWLP